MIFSYFFDTNTGNIILTIVLNLIGLIKLYDFVLDYPFDNKIFN